MKTLIRFIVSIAVFSPQANAQVLEPAWVYGKILQKTLHPSSLACDTKNETNRSIANTNTFNVRQVDGWKLVENKPEVSKKKVLMLPGFLGTDYVFHSMLRDPEMEKQGIKLIAGNAPGFDGLPISKGFDFSIESYADLVEKMAEKEHIDTLVGHSYMATVLSEVAKRGKFRGKIVMMSPALESDDEPLSTRALDLVTHDSVMKDVAWAGMYSFMETAFSEFFQPGDPHVAGAAAEARKTPIPYAQEMLKKYFSYLREQDNSFVKKIHTTPAEIHYVNGGKDVVQLKPENKKALESSGKVKFHHFPNASHMVMIDEAKNLNRILLKP